MIRFFNSPFLRSSSPGYKGEFVRKVMPNLEQQYPGFDWWFRNKVATGLRSGARKIFFETRECRVAGIAIAKREMQERKLCTLYVLPEFRNTGVASELAAEAFEWLGTEKPLFSVPEERINEFRTLIRMWDFHQTNPILGAYREGKVEYVFNGHLRPLC